ncbi:chromate transporter [Paenibacillus baekrokdamisoli]|uniref:Chromate transporter n=2 Tax=Paenibacillus baekrokdamisoli TaxID=1712516 RepID=A0A3G9IT82_9BACL|nr:chromate transporter [Paenibacillus baekrokdamisoli]BBH22077.1 chromate transporter [Paenibacillus baekrokdamisoli]
MLWELFVIFLKIGFVSFGGGYAVIPLIQYEIMAKGWLTNVQIQEAISLAGMAPGSIATNSATLIGYKSAGIAGAVMSTLGMVLPSLTVVVVLAIFFFRLQNNKWLKSSFYGLRPIITGLIVYAAIHFGFLGGDETGFTWTTIAALAICAGSLFAMLKYKLHPFAVILAGGVVGIILF